MKAGDLVRYAPVQGYAQSASKIGVIVDLVRIDARQNKYFKVLYCDGQWKDVWDFDLKVVNESR